MQQDKTFNALAEQTRSFFEPMRKLNGLMLDNMEKMTQFQLDSMKRYSQLGTERMRAASEIRDAEDMRDFTTRQTELMSELSRQMMDDARTMTELSMEFRGELEKAFSDVSQKAFAKAGNATQQASEAGKSAAESAKDSDSGKSTAESAKASSSSSSSSRGSHSHNSSNTNSSNNKSSNS